MTAIDVRTPSGATDGSVELPSEIFDVPANIPLIHQVVVAQLAAARRGTAKTKTRAEVSGGGRKPYKQKGTGRARQGSIRAPQFAGGGVVHGPVPRDYSQRTPKKMKAAALRGVLSDRAREDRISVVSSFVTDATPSTKTALAALSDWIDDGRLLIVLSREEESTWRSLRNVGPVALVASDQLSAYDAVISDRIVFSKEGLAAFISRGEKSEVAAQSTPDEKSAPVTEPAPAEKPAETSVATEESDEEASPVTKVTEAPMVVEETPAESEPSKEEQE